MPVSPKIKAFFSTAIMVYALASPMAAHAADVGNMRPIETRPAMMAAQDASNQEGIFAALQETLDQKQNRFHFKIENLTDHSKNIKNLQARFEGAVEGRPIIFLDYDEIALDSYVRALIDPSLGAQDSSFSSILLQEKYLSQAYIAAMSDYLTAKSGGLNFTNSETEYHASSLQQNDNNAFAVIVDAEGFSTTKNTTKTKSACIIVPMNPDLNAQLFLSFNLGIDAKNIKQLGQNPLNNNFNYIELTSFINYHEASHCLDFDNGDISLSNNQFKTATAHFHTGYTPLDDLHHESFADVRASLMMAQDGHKDTAAKMADIRMASLISHKDLTHYSTPALQIASRFIQKTSHTDLQNMDAAALTQKALQISQKAALTVAEYKFLNKNLTHKTEEIPSNMQGFHQKFEAQKSQILSRIIGGTKEDFIKAAQDYTKSQEKAAQKSQKNSFNLLADLAKTHYKSTQKAQKSIGSDFDIENFRITIKNSKDTLRDRKNNTTTSSAKKTHIAAKNSQKFSNMIETHTPLPKLKKTIKKMKLDKKSPKN